jgi:hypothetical protein
VARCVLPVAVPPTSTTLCAVSAKESVASWLTIAWSTLALAKSKLARPPLDRETCGMHLIGDGAQYLICVLRLQQVLDQPVRCLQGALPPCSSNSA